MTQVTLGQPSWALRGPFVQGWVTRKGAMVGPVSFKLGDRVVEPFHVAPWSDEPLPIPAMLQVLRGDFFCMPFGASEEPFDEVLDPPHGETANRDWGLTNLGDSRIELALSLSLREGTVSREVFGSPDAPVLGQQMTLRGVRGPMPVGTHAMLRFRTAGLVSVSPFVMGQVLPVPFEDPAQGGYSSLKQGAWFESLTKVEKADGSFADLTRYPAREGFEDLVMVAADPQAPLAWSAVVFPEEGYLWLQLKNPQTLRNTVLWHSNGGRHYMPWNGRHRSVLGVEEVTAYFHLGLAASVQKTPWSEAGHPTALPLDPQVPTSIRLLQLVAEIPHQFSRVERVERTHNGLLVLDVFGNRIEILIELDWLLDG